LDLETVKRKTERKKKNQNKKKAWAKYKKRKT
jgi:hypothetical protein